MEEAMAALDRLSLTVLSLDQYLVILNTKVDATLDGEPYLSLMLFFDTKSSNFLARIWNRTVASGQVLGTDHLIQLCKNHFNQGRPCVGYLKYGWLGKNMVTNDSAPACHLFLTNNYPKEVIMCPVCDGIFRGERELIPLQNYRRSLGVVTENTLTIWKKLPPKAEKILQCHLVPMNLKRMK